MVKLKKQKPRFRKRRFTFLPRPRNRFILILKFLITVAVVGVVGFGFVRLKYMFSDSGQFMINGIKVKLYDESGYLRDLSLANISNENIIGANIFFMDLKDLKQKIEAVHPEFKDIEIRRLLPNKLIVKANLRKPVAQIRSDRYYFVDEEGVLLPDVKNFPDPGLPIIGGVGINLAKAQAAKFSDFEKEKINKALGLIGEIRSIEGLAVYGLKVVDIADPGNISFFFDDVNIEIKIGNEDFLKRLNVLVTVLEQIDMDVDKFKYIDLRFEDPIIGPR
ncbi:cell division protein FtsQ/DivIB [Candidatus Omnitrophota bacterium]